MGFFSILLKREVETGRQTMAEGIKLSQWMFGRATWPMKRHSPVNCMVPPDTVADIQSNVLGKHKPDAQVGIRSDAETQHGDARILQQRTWTGRSQMMDIRVLDEAQRNKSRSSDHA